MPILPVSDLRSFQINALTESNLSDITTCVVSRGIIQASCFAAKGRTCGYGGEPFEYTLDKFVSASFPGALMFLGV